MRLQVVIAAAISGTMLAHPQIAPGQSPAGFEEPDGGGSDRPKRIRVVPAMVAAPSDAPIPVPRPEEGAIAAAAPASQEARAADNIRTYGLVGELLSEATDSESAEVDGDNLIQAALKPDESDLPEIRDRGFLRFAVAPDPLMIAFDGERAIGVAMDVAEELQKFLAERRSESGAPTVVVPTPTPRAAIGEAVDRGRADFAPLYTNDEEEAELAFTQPLLTGVNNIAVLGPEAPPVGSIDELADVRLYVSEGGRYAEDLREFNAARVEMGKEPLEVRHVDPRLRDHDLVEMAAIGLIPATVMSDHKARFWSQIYTGVKPRHDLKLSEAGRIAWAVRTENPKLRKALDAFAEKIKEGSLIGNTLMKRYYGETEWIENLDTVDAREFLSEVEPVIREYSEIYGFESDLVLAQAYQESRLDQSQRSHVGAIGVMQVMPTTAADPVVGIPDVTKLESNVEAGIKYLRWLRDTYYSKPEIAPLDQTLLSFAAYNAGPGGVQRAREKAREMGLDPNVWFENVEVAITKAVSREPATYVRNIFKYYVSYRLMQELELERQAARDTVAEIERMVEDLPAEQRVEALQEARILIEEGEGDDAPSSAQNDDGESTGAPGPAEDGEADRAGRAPVGGPRFRRP